MSQTRRGNRAILAILLLPVALAAAFVVYGRRADSKPKGSLVDAAKSQDFDSVEAHVRSGNPINATAPSGHTALYAAAGNKDLKMVQYLLSQGASPNGEAKGKDTPLIAAATAGDLAIVKLLVESGAELFPFSSSGQTPLHGAASGGNPQIIDYLLDKGLEVNARRKTDKATPICDAASAGHWEAIELLHRRGGDLDLTGFHRRTPVTLTILARKRTVARKLVEAGADINIGDADGAKPLHFSIVAGDIQLAEQLLAKTTNVGAYLRNGRNAVFTAVFYAAPNSFTQALIDAGCSPNQNNPTQTPLEIATENEDAALIAILKKGGAVK